MEAVSDFRNYPGKTRAELIDRLCYVTSELANAHAELGFTRRTEAEAKIRGFLGSEEGTVAGRERDAQGRALPVTLERLQLEANIEAITVERELILFLLGEQNAGHDQGMDRH